MTNKEALLARMKNDTTTMIMLLTAESCEPCPMVAACDIRDRDTPKCGCVFHKWMDAEADLDTTMAGLSESDQQAVTETVDKLMSGDAVHHPAYYNEGIECADYIYSHNMDFFRGNAVKYLTRAGKKDPAKEREDLLKAREYIDMELEYMDGGVANDDD